MKIIRYSLLIIIAIFMLTSCKEKKEIPNIVGTWKFQDSEIIKYTFNEDGTGTYNVANESVEFTYTIKDNILSITYKGYNNSVDAEYNVDGNYLNIKDLNDKYATYIKANSK